jgi:uncharacterized phage protein gp47/JayE
MSYGLTTEGFLAKTLSIIRDEMGVALQQAFGPSIRLDDQSILGQLVGIVAERLAILWELAEAVNSAQDPDSATGAGLEQVCLITGTFRPQATHSATTVTLTGDDTTIIPAASKISTASTGIEFQTTAQAVLFDLDPWVANTAYAVGDRVSSEGACFQCITAGTSSDTLGPTGSPDFEGDEDNDGDLEAQSADDIEDDSVHWIYLGEGTAAADTIASAVDTGVVLAVAGDLTTIVNAVSGWESVTNLLDATPGRAIATDSELRLLREQELATGGSSPINALRAELLNVPDVTAVTIFVNNTDTTDADGLPPHSIEAMVRGLEPPTDAYDQTIFDALLAGVAAGIRTASGTGGTSVTGTATDDQLTEHDMAFTRPEEIPIYVELTLVKDPNTYPTDGDDQIKQAIVDYGDLQNTGKDVVASRIIAAAFTVTGVLDVTSCFIDDAAAPTLSVTLPISLRELATYDTSRIDVITSDGVP